MKLESNWFCKKLRELNPQINSYWYVNQLIIHNMDMLKIVSREVRESINSKNNLQLFWHSRQCWRDDQIFCCCFHLTFHLPKYTQHSYIWFENWDTKTLDNCLSNLSIYCTFRWESYPRSWSRFCYQARLTST